MALERFPHETLGYPLIQNFGLEPAPRFDRLEPDRGPPVFRWRQSSPPDQYRATWYLSDELVYQRWRLWLEGSEDRLNQWLEMFLLHGETASGELIPVLREVHFASSPQVELDDQSMGWLVRATLDARFRAPTDPDA